MKQVTAILLGAGQRGAEAYASLFCCFSKYFIEALSGGAVKG